MLSSMTMLFVVFVLIGFVAQFIATFPNTPYMARIAWGSWLIAAIIWAIPQLH